MLEAWSIILDLTDSTLTPDVETLAALDSLLSYGPEYLDLCVERTRTYQRLVIEAKAQANKARN